MIRAAKDYAADLKLVENAKSNLQSVKDILEAVPQIGVEFEDPTVSLEKKHLVIDRVFPKEIRNFLKVLCDNGDFGLLDEIEQAYMELTKTPEKVEAQAELTYVTPPTPEQMERIRLFLAKEYNNPDIKIVGKEDASIKSGFIIRVGNKEYDWSEQGRIDQLQKHINQSLAGKKLATVSEERASFPSCVPISQILSWQQRIRRSVLSTGLVMVSRTSMVSTMHFTERSFSLIVVSRVWYRM